jgi:hypothetical protein
VVVAGSSDLAPFVPVVVVVELHAAAVVVVVDDGTVVDEPDVSPTACAADSSTIAPAIPTPLKAGASLVFIVHLRDPHAPSTWLAAGERNGFLPAPRDMQVKAR